MNQQDGPIGVPGGNSTAAPGARTPVPGGQGADTDRLLTGVEQQLGQLEGKSLQEQVPAFDRMHAAMADALARTTDTGGAPATGEPGA